MEVEAGLPPAWICVQTKVLLAMTRMQSLPPHPPFHQWLQSALRTQTAAVVHKSNIENILQQFPITATKLESRIHQNIYPSTMASRSTNFNDAFIGRNLQLTVNGTEG